MYTPEQNCKCSPFYLDNDGDCPYCGRVFSWKRYNKRKKTQQDVWLESMHKAGKLRMLAKTVH